MRMVRGEDEELGYSDSRRKISRVKRLRWREGEGRLFGLGGAIGLEAGGVLDEAI